MKKLTATFALILCAQVVCAEIFFDPATKRSRLCDPTEARPGEVELTEAEAAPHFVRDGDNYLVRTGLLPLHTKVVDDKPVEMSAAEKAAVNLTLARRSALSRAAGAETRLLGLEALKARLTSAGKSTVAVQAEIDARTAILNTAVGNLP